MNETVKTPSAQSTKLQQGLEKHPPAMCHAMSQDYLENIRSYNQ